MSATEEIPQAGDPMWHHSHSSESLDDFLKAHQPSKGSPQHAWIWVKGKRVTDQGHPTPEQYEAMMVELAQLTSKLEADAEKIQNDDSIPVRGSKAKGKSKKQHKDALHQPFVDALKDVAFKYNDKSGKLLFYWDATVVDANFRKLAEAMINEDGAFRRAGLPVSTLKVASQPNAPEAPRVVCLYLEDSWDRDAVKATWKTLMADVGLSSKSYKADVMTLAGINSGHPSGIKSSLYSQSDFFTNQEVDDIFNAKKGQLQKKKETAAQEKRRGPQLDSDTESEEDAPPPAKKSKT